VLLPALVEAPADADAADDSGDGKGEEDDCGSLMGDGGGAKVKTPS
jgi:hypothetical protein